MEQLPPWTCEGNKKMEAFLTCPADEILFGGSAGSGKTESLLISALGGGETNIFTNPNWKVLFLRRTFPELENSAILRSQALLSDKGRYDGVKHRWSFPRGGILQFGHVKTEDELYKHHSAEWTMLIFDELTTFLERMYLYLFSRLRSRDPNIRPKVKSATNPGSIGHAWVRKRFIENKTPNQIYHSEIILPDGTKTDWSQVFIPAFVTDNKFLVKTDPLYVRRLMELPEVEKQALLYGNWDIFSGQFFPEFSEDHIEEDFAIPNDWPIWIGMDWGYMTKCAVLFFTQDPETKMYHCFREIYVTKIAADGVAEMIKSSLGDLLKNVKGKYTDKRIKIREEGGANISTQEKFQFHGIFFEVVDDSRVQGWHRCRELLLKDKEGSPRMKIFRSCVNFIRSLSEAIFDSKNPEDMNTHSEAQHCCDSFRYWAITRKVTEDPEQKRLLEFSSVTGYIGSRGDDTPLRHKIRRLPGLVHGKNYFIDRAS